MPMTCRRSRPSTCLHPTPTRTQPARAGKVQAAVGLERLQSSNATASIELGLPSTGAGPRHRRAAAGRFLPAAGSAARWVTTASGDGRTGREQLPVNRRRLPKWPARGVRLSRGRTAPTRFVRLALHRRQPRRQASATGNNCPAALPHPGPVPVLQSIAASVLADGEHLRIAPQAATTARTVSRAEHTSVPTGTCRPAAGARADTDNSARQSAPAGC